MSLQITLDQAQISAFCQKWKIAELSLFGSVLRDDFRPDSDVDVLVSFEPGAPWDLWDLMRMQEELGVIFERKVDLVEKKALQNPFRRHEILATRDLIYAA